MALSNWDTLAVNEKGEATNGEFTTRKKGVVALIYKNWMYVRDGENMVMEIQHGEFSYKDLHVFAIRGPKNGIYVVCWDDHWSIENVEPFSNMVVGVGLYGFSGEDWVGVEQNEVFFLDGHFQSFVRQECNNQ